MAIYKSPGKVNISKKISQIATNAGLTALAKIILIYALSKPDNWNLHIWETVKHLKEGITAVRRAFRELEENGYIHRQPLRENGKFAGVAYDVYEEPSLNPHFCPQAAETGTDLLPIVSTSDDENPDVALPRTVFPDAVMRDRNIINIENNNSINNSNLNYSIYLTQSIYPTVKDATEEIQKKIQYESLILQFNPKYVDNLVDTMVNAVMTISPTIQVSRYNILRTDFVHSQIQQVNYWHAEFVLRVLEQDNRPIVNMSGYILTVLLKAIQTLDLGYKYSDL